MHVQNISITKLETNKGQVEGLPKNPRLIKDEKFKQLVQSIKDDPEMLALRECIVYPFEKKFVVIGGNMRLEACKELKHTDIPCKVLEKDTPVSKLRAYAIKDNVAYGENDWDLLANDWDANELLEWGMDIPDFVNKKEAHEDDYVIPDEIETDIVPGDLFEIGQHRLLCGDSTKAEDVEKLMNGQKADMVFTDPPYAVKYGDDEERHKLGGRLSKKNSQSSIVNDNLSVKEISELIWRPSFRNMYEAANDDCSFYMTMCQGGDQMMMMMMMMMSEHWQVKHELIWVKSSPVFSMGRLNYDYQHEPIIFGWKKKHNWYGKGQFIKSVWEIPKPSKSEHHPTMKPIALIENAVLNSSKENDLIIDFFTGSGSTLITSHQLNRICYGMEIEPKYCQVILDRMLKLDAAIEIKKNGEYVVKTL